MPTGGERGLESMEALVRDAAAMGIRVGPREREMVGIFVREMLRWNERTNLTAIRCSGDLMTRHILDSMVAGLLVGGEETVVDLGTGAGLPGIPMKILHPGMGLVLVESRRKKVSFLRDAVRRMRLDRTEVRWTRAEEAGFLASFEGRSVDWVISRAALKDEECLGVGNRLIGARGRVVLMKGSLGAEHLDSLMGLAGRFGMRLARRVPYRLPGLDRTRHLVVFEREG